MQYFDLFGVWVSWNKNAPEIFTLRSYNIFLLLLEQVAASFYKDLKQFFNPK